jgi:hypothetical protein
MQLDRAVWGLTDICGGLGSGGLHLSIVKNKQLLRTTNTGVLHCVQDDNLKTNNGNDVKQATTNFWAGS